MIQTSKGFQLETSSTKMEPEQKFAWNNSTKITFSLSTTIYDSRNFDEGINNERLVIV